MDDRLNSPGMRAQRDATAKDGHTSAPIEIETRCVALAQNYAKMFYLDGNLLGANWSRGNALAVLLSETFNLMCGFDSGLACEFLEQMLIVRRTSADRESPEHLAAYARVGVILGELGQFDTGGRNVK